MDFNNFGDNAVNKTAFRRKEGRNGTWPVLLNRVPATLVISLGSCIMVRQVVVVVVVVGIRAPVELGFPRRGSCCGFDMDKVASLCV
jgi:hypothetical protein